MQRPKREQYEIENYMTSYGFFINGNNPDCYFNEFNIMYRKILIIFSTDFLRNTSNEV
jgi:hypothetical protein